MAAGFGLMRMTSAAFWALTPRELAAALEAFAPAAASPPGRGDLAALTARFPDR